jgi:hypothetical protein
MKDWPTDPMAQYNLMIAALCEDIMATGKFSLDGPNVTRVTAINNILNGERPGRGNSSRRNDQ